MTCGSSNNKHCFTHTASILLYLYTEHINKTNSHDKLVIQ